MLQQANSRITTGKSAGALRRNLRSVGVRVGRIRRALQEIERKTFHICGLVVPIACASLPPVAPAMLLPTACDESTIGLAVP
eukprot:SAG11_NODE_12_length_27025_cov_37.402681_16_plen_82_part_00